jgi:molecular chaperone GrpE
MASDKKTRNQNRIPIKFLDSELRDSSAEQEWESAADEGHNDDQVEILSGYKMEENDETNFDDEPDDDEPIDDVPHPSSAGFAGTTGDLAGGAGGPAVAELVATRAELKRVESEVAELRDRLARRQADFENYRKRVDRERNETYGKVAADLAAKLLPVLDNLSRALDAESSVESSESDEFRHFLSGVDLIYKQLEGVIDAMGVKPVAAVGEIFNPHLHEAVVTEATDEYEPDTVMQEIVRGYRMGDKLIRPSLVKVATKK